MAYGPADQPITISPASLADWAAAQAARASDVIDFEAILAALGTLSDILVFGQSKLVAGTPSTYRALYVYAYATVGGTSYPDAVTGADAAITTNNPFNIGRIGAIMMGAGNTSYSAGPWSFRAAFGGTLPSKGGIVLINLTGLALSSTDGDHIFTYQAVP